MTMVDLSELHKNILNATLAKLKNLLGAESASLFLFDQERKELVLNSIFDERKVQFKGRRQRIGEGVAGCVANECKAVLVKDIKTDPRFPKERYRHYQTNSFICSPIVTSDGLIGIISISDKTSGEAFTEQDFQLACLISQLTSHIVENEIQLVLLKEQAEALKKEKTNSQEEEVFLKKFASMGKLAGGIVHEINNPLDAVLRYTNILIEKEIDETIAKEYLGEIKVGLTRIMKITRSLLEFAQLLKDNECQEAVDVNAMVEEALSLFRHTIFLGSIKIEKNLAPSLPRIADKGLCRVFSNIIKNSFDAMPDGGVLTITTAHSSDAITISFKDTGCGISQEVREKIFTPFFTTKPIGQGIGLGLPICFEVIQRYGGKIEVQSDANVGTEFKISLPIKNVVLP